MMRGFPHVLRNVRALDLNRGCVPLALRTPWVWGAAFYFSSPIKSHQCDLLGDLVMVAALAKKLLSAVCFGEACLEPKALVVSLLFFGLVF